MGTRIRSVGALVHPTFWSSPRMLRLTWLWTVVWLESCNPTMGSVTSTMTTCTACLPPWLVCDLSVWLVRRQWTEAVWHRNSENEIHWIWRTVQIWKGAFQCLCLHVLTTPPGFGPTGLPISSADHREDVREQHQSHLCCHQPCGSSVPGQELCSSAFYSIQVLWFGSCTGRLETPN